jgi:16S rRNA C967 or C1407 C5-methylase (RsmB/RsmF family)
MLPKKIRKKVRCINMDFLKVDPDTPEMKEVRYILLDPSCSGSGMLTSSKINGTFTLLEKAYKTNKNYKEVITNLYRSLLPKEQRNIKSF